jgi:hypothetical protein
MSWCRIGRAQHQDGATLPQDLVWVGTALASALGYQIAHLAVTAGSQPSFVDVEVRRRVRAGHADELEAEAPRFGLDFLGKGHEGILT